MKSYPALNVNYFNDTDFIQEDVIKVIFWEQTTKKPKWKPPDKKMSSVPMMSDYKFR